MKQITLNLCLLFVLGTTLFSCKKEDNPEPTTPSTPALKTFALTLDGTSYQSTTLFKQVINNTIVAQTTINSNLNFGLSIADSLVPGTYNMGLAEPARLTHSDDNYATSYGSITGSITIVTHDQTNRKISGTYSCTLTRASPASTKSVTNAEFNYSY